MNDPGTWHRETVWSMISRWEPVELVAQRMMDVTAEWGEELALGWWVDMARRMTGTEDADALVRYLEAFGLACQPTPGWCQALGMAISSYLDVRSELLRMCAVIVLGAASSRLNIDIPVPLSPAAEIWLHQRRQALQSIPCVPMIPCDD